MAGKDQAIDMNRPLFIPKANPRDYAQWATEYEEMENKHMKPLHGNGLKVHNLQSLRNGLKHRIIPPQRSSKRSPPRPKPPISSAVPDKLSPMQGFAHKRPNSAHVMKVRTPPPRPASPLSPTIRRIKKIDKQVLSTIMNIVNKEGLVSRFNVDARAMDLKWLKKQDIVVPHLNTLSTLSTELVREDGSLNEEYPLNSPRSIYVLFNNGVAVADLQKIPLSDYTCDKAHAKRMKKHHDAMRAELLKSLIVQYTDFCADVSLQDITSILNTPGAEAATSTANEKRKQQSQRALEATRLRLEKQCRDVQAKSEMENNAAQDRERRMKQLEEDKKLKQQELNERMKESTRRQAERVMELQRNHEKEQQAISEKLTAMEMRDWTRKQKEEERTAALKQSREAKRKVKQEHIANNIRRSEEHLEETRDVVMKRITVAEQRKMERDAQAHAERQRNKDQNVVVTKRRLERLDRVKEEAAEQQQKGLQKQAAADENQKKFQLMKQQEWELKSKREKTLSESRAEKKAFAEQLADEMKQQRIQKQEQRGRDFKAARDEQESKREIKKDQQTADMNEKRFKVLCHSRQEEFQKAILLKNIETKELRVETCNNAKAALLQQCWQERHQLKKNKENIMQSF